MKWVLVFFNKKETIQTFKPGEALHLILHALGIPNEHVRENRGDKVWINWENINLEVF